MAPNPISFASGNTSTFGNVSVGAHLHPMPCQSANESQWGADTITNVVFGTIMVFISIVAIYQARQQQRTRKGHGEIHVRISKLSY